MELKRNIDVDSAPAYHTRSCGKEEEGEVSRPNGAVLSFENNDVRAEMVHFKLAVDCSLTGIGTDRNV